jgi:drug/metabolite transporter (DMT)-like permease
MNHPAVGLALILLAALSYAAMPVLAKVAYAAGASLPALLADRFLIAAALFALLAPRREPLRLRRRALLWGLGLVYVANAYCYFKALETIPASVLSVVLYSYPVMVALLAGLLGLERLSARSLLAAALALAGVVLSAGRPAGFVNLGGLGLALASAFCYAVYIVLGSRAAPWATGEAVARHVAQVCAACYLPWAALRGVLLAPLAPTAWLAILAIAGISTVLALRAFLSALERLGPTRAAVASTVEIVFAVALAAVFLGEAVPPRLWAGGVLIVLAVACQNLTAVRTGLRVTSRPSRGPSGPIAL